MHTPALGVIVGNRDFFPDRLVTQGRAEILSVLADLGIEVVILDEAATKLGAVETWQDAQLCAELFSANRSRIDGILVTLPNFGDEKGATDTIRLADLRVPVLIQATPDDPARMGLDRLGQGIRIRPDDRDCRDPGDDPGAGTHVRWARGACIPPPDHVRARHDRRPEPPNPRDRGRGPLHRRSPGHLRDHRRGRDSEAAGPPGVICRNGFEHHAAMSPALAGGVLEEALETYLGWDVYRHFE